MGTEKLCLDKNIYRFIYIEAVTDATIQRSYKGDNNKEKKWLKSEEVVDELWGIISPFINSVLSGEYSFDKQQKYDEDFLDVTVKICDYINNRAQNNNFSFGNAQKLVNMMLKYFFITNYKSEKLKENFRCCHCPMDQQLLKKIWENRSKLSKDICLGKYEEFLKSWGNEDFDHSENGERIYPKRYLLFQKAVREMAKDMSSMEYDYYIWNGNVMS